MKINVSFDIGDLEGYFGSETLEAHIASCIQTDLLKALKASKEYKQHIDKLKIEALEKLV
tara:strand:- start:694 stop:873 length:180 start_codon:yes stop_codon:yes gene_type:complete